MPYADPEKQAEYLREYNRKHKEKRNLERRERYRRSRPKSEGPEGKPRKSPRGKTRITVGKKWRWVIYGDRLYTNSETGWTVADLLEMASELTKAQAKAAAKAGEVK